VSPACATAAETRTVDALSALESACDVRTAHIGVNPQVTSCYIFRTIFHCLGYTLRIKLLYRAVERAHFSFAGFSSRVSVANGILHEQQIRCCSFHVQTILLIGFVA
jgi:hypothetical protein